jgi:hypothetical protein
MTTRIFYHGQRVCGWPWALANEFAEAPEVLHIVLLLATNHSARNAGTNANRSMIELVEMANVLVIGRCRLRGLPLVLMPLHPILTSLRLMFYLFANCQTC